VLLDGSGFAKLTDFGLSRSLGAGTESGEGTYQITSALPIRWSAPESLSQREASVASDVYSLGITMWEVYSRGKLPFAEKVDNTAVVAAVVSGERPERPDDTPDDIWDWMQRCWTADPASRPRAGEVSRALDTATIDLSSAGPDSVNAGSAFTPSTAPVDDYQGV
jgi:serine/threonine protein kinase